MVNDPKRFMSAFNILEAAIVMDARKGPAGARELDLLLHATAIEVVALTTDQIAVARRAYSDYGKGHHPAALNLGDCCSYALSQVSGESLLFKGRDFVQTDVARCL